MATSDGIRTEDWDVAHALAVEIVNAGSGRADEVRQQLLSYLEMLEQRYGALPSILATRADYLAPDDPAREELLIRAHAAAESRGDTANVVLAAQSLAELFLEWRRLPDADRWLTHLREYEERFGADQGTSQLHSAA